MAIENLEQGMGLIYRSLGRKGPESIENVGPRLAEVVADLLAKLLSGPPGGLTPVNSARLSKFPFF